MKEFEAFIKLILSYKYKPKNKAKKPRKTLQIKKKPDDLKKK